VREVIGSPGEKHHTNLFLRPIPLEPGGTREIRLSVRSTHTPPAPFGVERLRATLPANAVFPVHYKRGFTPSITFTLTFHHDMVFFMSLIQ